MKTNTTVSLPVEVKIKALSHGIGFSQTLVEALTKKIEDLEREGGKPVPAPGYPDAITTEAEPC